MKTGGRRGLLARFRVGGQPVELRRRAKHQFAIFRLGPHGGAIAAELSQISVFLGAFHDPKLSEPERTRP